MAATIDDYHHSYPLEGDSEVERLQNQHDVIKDAMGKLVLAPIDLSAAPLRILDSGTSDGTWVQDIAQSSGSVKHELVGTDINADIFPTDPPADITYQVQDINKPWPAEWKGTFDLVHQRLVLAGAGNKQREAITALEALVKPGGWIQLIEATNDLPDGCGPVMHDFVSTIKSIFTFLGTEPDFANKLAGWLKDDGFVDVQDRLVPTKHGAKNPDPILASQGVFSTTTAAKSLAQFGKTLPPGSMTLSPEKLDTLSSDLKQELMTQGGIYPLRVVWGRKPL